MRGALALVAGLVLVGCTSSPASDVGDAAPQPDAPSDSATAADCSAKFSGAVAKAQPGDVCTAVLRISEKEQLQSVSCGPMKSVTQASAEAEFEDPMVGPPYWAFAQGALPEAWVYYHDPMDSGGVGVVSGATGMLVVQVGTNYLSGGAPKGGTILAPPPSEWAPVPACVGKAKLPAAKGLSLDGGQIPSAGPMDAAAIADAVSQLAATPLPDEIVARGTIRFVLVLDNDAAGRLVIVESEPFGS